jgi:ribulose kinase
MEKYFLLSLLIMLALAQSSCALIGGAATGAVATTAAYEIQAKRQMDRVEEDFKKRRISREEYEDRKRQIEKGSIVY